MERTKPSPMTRIVEDLGNGLRNVVGEFSWRIYVAPILSVVCRIINLRRYYGLITSIVLNTFVRNVWCIEADILYNGKDGLAESFYKFQRSECEMTAITGAIVASIATTALQFDKLPDTHWPARGLIVASLILGLLSVYCASKQQKTIGRLLNADQVRRFVGIKKDIVLGTTPPPKKLRNYLFFKSAFPHSGREDDEDITDEGFIYLPSPASCLLVSAPRLLLASSVISFIAGIGVYLGSLSAATLEGGGARNAFIVYCIVTFLSCIFYVQSTLVQWSQAVEDEGDQIVSDIIERRSRILKKFNCSETRDFSSIRDDEAFQRRHRQQPCETEATNREPQHESRSQTRCVPSYEKSDALPNPGEDLESQKIGQDVSITPKSPSQSPASYIDAHVQLAQQLQRLAGEFEQMSRRYAEMQQPVSPQPRPSRWRRWG